MTAHIDALLDDYCLGLLPPGRRRLVEQHVATCPRCTELLARERESHARTRDAFRSAASAPAGRLEALWPSVAAAAGVAGWRRPRVAWFPQWRTWLVTAAVALLVLTGTVGTVRRFDGWLLATFTPSPTASLTPTIAHAAPHTPQRLETSSVAYRPVGWGTPEPTLPAIIDAVPEPRPNPLAPANNGN